MDESLRVLKAKSSSHRSLPFPGLIGHVTAHRKHALGETRATSFTRQEPGTSLVKFPRVESFMAATSLKISPRLSCIAQRTFGICWEEL